MWREVRVEAFFSSFLIIHLAQHHFHKEIFLSPLNYLGAFIENQSTVYVWVCFWILSSLLLFYFLENFM